MAFGRDFYLLMGDLRRFFTNFVPLIENAVNSISRKKLITGTHKIVTRYVTNAV